MKLTLTEVMFLNLCLKDLVIVVVIVIVVGVVKWKWVMRIVEVENGVQK